VLRVLDVYPGSRIPDPKTATKERGAKIFCCIFFCRHKFHKIENHFIFELVEKRSGANLQKITEQKLSKIWVWDPRSGIQGLKKAPDPGSEFATLVF
jgi:hypothetical protein